MVNDTTTTQQLPHRRDSRVYMYLGGSVLAAWIVLVTATVIMFTNRVHSYATLPYLALATVGLLAVTVVVVGLLGCRWLDQRVAVQLAGLVELVERAAALAEISRPSSLESYLADAATAYEIGRGAGRATRRDDEGGRAGADA